jgi:predicted RNA-binding protein with PIN domain
VHWIIDGHNVILRTPWLASVHDDDRQAGREALINRVANLAQRSPRDRFTIVFDGQRGGSQHRSAAGVEVRYSSARGDADTLILRSAAAGATVVSDDRELCGSARRAGARTMPAGEFVTRLSRR